MKIKIAVLLIGAVLALAAVIPQKAEAQSSNPLINFLNPTNSFLTAQELNVTADFGYQRERRFSTGIGARWWISDSQGASVAYEAFPHTDKGEWQLAYGYRTAWQKMELSFFAGMANDVDNDLLFRPYIEINAVYQISPRYGVGLKTQIVESERPLIGGIFTWKFGK